MVVEWKRLLREAGVEDVHVEDWSDEETSFRSTVVKPFPDFAEMFSLGERLAILRRAWKKWGWRGVSAALAREQEVHKLLTGERILGLDLLRGRKARGPEVEVSSGAVESPGEASPPAATASAPATHAEDVTAVGARIGHDEGDADDETTGLPLFRGDPEASGSDQ